MDAFDPRTEQLEFIAGDQPVAVQQGRAYDPTGTGLVGHHQTVRLDKSAIGHPYVRYQDGTIDRVLECDVYLLAGADWEGVDHSKFEVILICPRCLNQLRVTSDRKQIQWTPTPPEVDASSKEVVVRGVLSIEPFQCTWEKDGKRDPNAPVFSHGENLCRWKVGIYNNVARDA